MTELDKLYSSPTITNKIADKLKELKATKPPKQIIEENLPGAVFIDEQLKFNSSPGGRDYTFKIRYGGYEWVGVKVIENTIHYDYFVEIGEKPKKSDSDYVYDFYNK